MRTFLNRFQHKNNIVAFAAGLVVAVASLVGASTLGARTVLADSSSNDIICGGFSTPTDFIQKVREVNTNNGANNCGHHDLVGIYANQFVAGQNLTTAMYSDFASHAQAGLAYQNGDVKVGDKLVATNTSSIGRLASFQGPNPKTYTAGTGTYYGNTNDRAFASGPLPVYVLFNSTGTMQFAVLKSCGNPVFGHAIPTSASCNELRKTAVSGQLNTYDFNGLINTAGNVTVKKFIYNFGDGSAPVVITSNFNQAVRHQYTKASGSKPFTASVTEIVSVPGNDNLQLPVISLCTKPVVVELPFFACTLLSGLPTDTKKYIYTFTAKANFGPSGVVSLASGDFNFGDGTTKNFPKTTANTVVASHQYTVPDKKYTITALLHFVVNGKPAVAKTACPTSVTPKSLQPTTPECKPNVPEGSPECAPPCTEGSSVPPESPQCNQATELPNTGAGNTIALFSAVLIAGFLVYRQLLFRRHKAAFLAAEQGTSALPLADPLSPDAPLADTPLAPKRRSFRRNRPF